MSELERNPWQTLSSRVVYETAWMTVREDQVIRPDGQPGIYGFVEKSVATGVVAVDEQGQVVLVGQYRYPTRRYSWELPEGGSEPGETPLRAAQRELREETGLAAARWEPLGDVVQLSNCITSELGYLFLARGLTQLSAPSPDPTELLRVTWIPFAEAVRRAVEADISDLMSIAGLLRAARHPELAAYL
ncbi:MAG: NUDIX domain-containing protein [Planctomycetota bacterium]